MKRTSISFLKKWIHSKDRLPLVVRGARQVGKTWLVRHFAELEKKDLIEINFERTPHLADLFDSNDPKKILERLERALQISINAKGALLFLDEIQAKPEIYAKLRWFAEDMPELPVIAAGSLLEFMLGSETLSMPVGRVGYMHLEPLSFIEFLLASNRSKLVEEIQEYTWDKEIHPIIHEEIMKLFTEYLYVGGMPKAVSSWMSERSMSAITYIHQGLIASYRDDFKKYGGRIDPEILDKIMEMVPLELGTKFMYSRVDSNTKSHTIKKAFNLLCMARVCHKVISTDANGIPLGAGINDKYFKAILLDVGLCSNSLGLTLEKLEDLKDLELVNKGGIAEQITGQLLRTIELPYENPRLFYWIRHNKQTDAELDFVIKHHTKVIPIEVKAGSRGSLKSLHLFMEIKELKDAVRISSAAPIKTHMKIKGFTKQVSYNLYSIPFYLISELHRLLDVK